MDKEIKTLEEAISRLEKIKNLSRIQQRCSEVRIKTSEASIILSKVILGKLKGKIIEDEMTAALKAISLTSEARVIQSELEADIKILKRVGEYNTTELVTLFTKTEELVKDLENLINNADSLLTKSIELRRLSK